MQISKIICGVDEAGRGPLAGSVYAAAVILDANQPIIGLADSKKLSEKRRDALAIEIKQKALVWAVASCTAQEIDEINILQASLLAMKRAIEDIQAQLKITSAMGEITHEILVQVDGNKCPNISLPCEAIVKGDSKVQAISAASILAKTARDAELYELDKIYPQYGFAQHKGYPTAAHLAALAAHGICVEHRLSFAPVKKIVRGLV
jgi:ribonuclease HII